MVKLKAVVIMCIMTVLLSFTAANAQVSESYADGVLKISGTGEMQDYEKSSEKPWDAYKDEVKKIEIGEGVTSIGSWSFYGLDNLSRIDFPKSLEKIGNRAFYDCKSLTEIKLNVGLKSIGDGAFNGCKGVRRIDMPYTLKKIGSSAFMNLPGLNSITLPENIEWIGEWAFMGCTNLKGIYFEGYMPKHFGKFMLVDIAEDYNVFYNEDYKESWKDCYVIPPEKLKTYSKRNRIYVYVNNNEVVFDQMPVIENGRTLVPLRAIFEAMGAEVTWNDETREVTAEKDSTVILLKIDSDVMFKNGEQIKLDVPAKIIGGRTLVPARAVSEAFGAKVEWNEAERAVYITK